MWCTKLADFMLSGQDKNVGQTLSDCCERRGIRTKTDKVKTYWDAGKNTAEIPLRILLPYQKNDVQITADLFKDQYREAVKQEALLKLIKIRQKNLHILTDIELKGMPFDRPAAEHEVKHFSTQLDYTNSELVTLLNRADINLGSGQDLSCALFGGNLKRVRDVPLMMDRNVTIKEPFQYTYLGGKRKGMTITKYKNVVLKEIICKKRKENYEVTIPGCGFSPQSGTETSTEGIYKTNKGVLANLSCNNKGGTTVKHKRRVLELLLHRSKIAKFIETFVGVQAGTGLFHKADQNVDGWLHPNYNDTIAATGRLTSSGPNGQNFPRSKADADGFTNPLKSCFVPSRPGGLILVIDMSQLEWRVAAWLSQDQVAMREILDGTDIHTDNAINFFGDIKYRQQAKIMTFRLLYGGGAYAFFMDPLMPNFSQKKWNTIVSNYNLKYRGIARWQEKNISLVPRNKGILYSPTGRIYKIPKVPHRKHPNTFVFSDTTIKNYPVQGTATGDIVPMGMNMIQDRFEAAPRKYMSTNWMGQVHDSVIFDTMPHEVKRVAKLGIDVFEKLPAEMNREWGVDFNLPLTGEAEAGRNYGDLTWSVKHLDGEWITKGSF